MPKVESLSSILVIVDRVSEYAVLILAPNACPTDIAVELFVKHVVKYFGIPKDINSFQSARFTSRFWTLLFNIIKIFMKFSTTNNP